MEWCSLLENVIHATSANSEKLSSCIKTVIPVFILFPMLQSHDAWKANDLAYTKDNMLNVTRKQALLLLMWLWVKPSRFFSPFLQQENVSLLAAAHTLKEWNYQEWRDSGDLRSRLVLTHAVCTKNHLLVNTCAPVLLFSCRLLL